MSGRCGGLAGRTPFHTCLWELYAIAFWRFLVGCHNLYRPWVQYPGSDKRVLAKTEWFHRLGESYPFLYVYPLFRVFASPYTIYAEGVDHPIPQVTENKAVAFLDTLLYEVFLKLHPRLGCLACGVASVG